MPAIIIKDYTWRQTSEIVILHVPLPGHPKMPDLFINNNYLKVSFPPFLLELFLWANVIEEKSKCTVTDREAIFSLQKEDIGIEWPCLELQDIDDEVKREYRKRAVEHAQKVAEDRLKAKNEKRQKLQKQAVKEQINIDTATLNRIDAMRDGHRKEAMRELEDWRSNAALPLLQGCEGEIQENRKAYRPPLKWFKDDDGTVKSRELTHEEVTNNKVQITEIQSNDVEEVEAVVSQEKLSHSTSENGELVDNTEAPQTELKEENSVSKCEAKAKTINNLSNNMDESSSSEDSDSSDDTLQKKKGEKPKNSLIDRLIAGRLVKRNSIFEDPKKAVPLPRKNGVINISFSERAFPTPARESAHLEEQEWLAKQAEARRKTGFVVEDLRPEELDPQWLKDKGDDFYKVGNYLGAISAYTHGIKISDKMSSLYVNRSAAHYALGNYHRCIDDCSKALELMEPKCEGNRESRARCHARRGAALCKLSAPQHGIPELQAALKLAPDNDSIKHDVLAAKQYFEIKD